MTEDGRADDRLTGLAAPRYVAVGTPRAGNAPAEEQGPIYGALDLGTNNCRLLVARASRRGFSVIDAFSRIIRLGEGMSATGALSQAAMDRAVAALAVCAEKLGRRQVARARLVTTEACRAASNGREFLARVEAETGLALEIIDRETEAYLAVAGCIPLIDRGSQHALVFDIGGGSTEIVWLKIAGLGRAEQVIASPRGLDGAMLGWASLPIGVVNLAERHGGRVVTPASFEAMVAEVTAALRVFESRAGLTGTLQRGRAHFVGTSGTATTIAGIHLGLSAYSRTKVDGQWLTAEDVRSVTPRVMALDFATRAAQPCIGEERADLVLPGCAIVEAMLRLWPCERVRIADRGLREGILTTLMAQDRLAARAVRRLGA